MSDVVARRRGQAARHAGRRAARQADGWEARCVARWRPRLRACWRARRRGVLACVQVGRGGVRAGGACGQARWRARWRGVLACALARALARALTCLLARALAGLLASALACLLARALAGLLASALRADGEERDALSLGTAETSGEQAVIVGVLLTLIFLVYNGRFPSIFPSRKSTQYDNLSATALRKIQAEDAALLAPEEPESEGESQAAFDADEGPYYMEPRVKDWDEQRNAYIAAHPGCNATRDGKPKVMLVSGSNSKRCGEGPNSGDFLLLKFLKNKQDYARGSLTVPLVPPHPLPPAPTLPAADWDEQRNAYIAAHPGCNATRDGKPKVMLVSGSNSKRCGEGPNSGDFLLLKFLKNKQDYARVNDMPFYYGMGAIDPRLKTFWVKLPMLRMLMLQHPDVEWFLWVDSDAMITGEAR
ncbi:unnamed protein product [Closterium sp. NIES-64]|nr:unnamed protein product [Closterium sp. NIES-64]